MSDFENAVKAAAEKAVLKIITEGSWVQPDYANRVRLPKDFMVDVWKMVDTEKIKQHLAARLESELADRLVNHMAAEIATDVKQILSVTERREALRSIAREHMETIMQAGVGKQRGREGSVFCFPLDEPCYDHLIRLHIRLGQQSEARNSQRQALPRRRSREEE